MNTHLLFITYPTMRNVEIKARITNLENICKVAEELSGGPPSIIKQDDTFYRVNNGRLKMRYYADNSATLVRYSRDDLEGPKLADYDLLQFSVAEGEKAKLLDKMLRNCLGARGRVVKERLVYCLDTHFINCSIRKYLVKCYDE